MRELLKGKVATSFLIVYFAAILIYSIIVIVYQYKTNNLSQISDIFNKNFEYYLIPILIMAYLAFKEW